MPMSLFENSFLKEDLKQLGVLFKTGKMLQSFEAGSKKVLDTFLSAGHPGLLVSPSHLL